MRKDLIKHTHSAGPFAFHLQTNARFGVGVALTLPDILLSWNYRRVRVIQDGGLRTNSQAQDLIERLRSAFPELIVFENDVVEPDYDYLDQFKDKFNHKFDVLIGMGGGSTLDLTKAISVLATNPGPAIQYRGFDLVKNPGIPMIALPTTAGTGSEVTPNAVFTDKREMRKLGINSSLYLPRLALLDPLMTVTCPRAVTISSGMDALVHSVESYVAKSATPISRMFSREAFSLVFNTLQLVVDEPENLELRARMQLGAYYAGVALMNSGAGPAGAMSYPLGVRFKVPHGLAGGIFLPEIVELNVESGCILYADLYDLIDQAETDLNAHEKSSKLTLMLRQLQNRLDVAKTLDVFGVSHEHIPVLVRETLLLRGALEQNPISFNVEQVRMILKQMTLREGS